MSQKTQQINEKMYLQKDAVVLKTLVNTYLWMKCPVCGKEIEFDKFGNIQVNIGKGFKEENIPNMLFYKSGEHAEGCPWRDINE